MSFNHNHWRGCTTSLSLRKFSNGIDTSDAWRYQGAWSINAFVTVAEEAFLRCYWWKGIDADNLYVRIPLAVKDNIQQIGILTTAASKMLSYNYEPIFWCGSCCQCQSQRYDCHRKDQQLMSLPWWIWWDFLLWDQPRMLGTRARCLVDERFSSLSPGQVRLSRFR